MNTLSELLIVNDLVWFESYKLLLSTKKQFLIIVTHKKRIHFINYLN